MPRAPSPWRDDTAPPTAGEAENLGCVAREVRRIHDLLGLGSGEPAVREARYVTRPLLRRELSVAAGSASGPTCCSPGSLPEGGGAGRMSDWIAAAATDDELTGCCSR